MTRQSTAVVRLGAIVAVVLVAGLAGCAVLTDSQVAEVRRFAEATEDYSDLPGNVVRAYGVLARDIELLALSRRQFDVKNARGEIDPEPANEAWDAIGKAYALEQEFSAVGKQMDAALTVLRTYSAVLTSLTSDEYTDALGEQAARLGRSLDDATESYNKSFKPAQPLASVGAAIAGVIRGAGGLYIRHRQAVALRDTVAAAQPLVDGLMDQVGLIARNQQADFKNAEERRLAGQFKSVAINTGRLPVTTLERVYGDLVAARVGRQLAERVEHSAATYQRAHRELVNNTRRRANLGAVIAEIEALQQEIKAAKQTSDRLGN